MKKAIFIITVLLVELTVTAQQPSASAQLKNEPRLRTLIVFFDGLRPDYITRENMPNLFAFKATSAYGKQHHSVFPTVTRVNAASYATGSYPFTHGIMGNAVYFPSVNTSKSFSTGNFNNLVKANEAEKGHLLTTTSLGEVLAKAGEKMMVFSSGSTGQAFLQNHTISGGMIVNVDTILPLALQQTVWDAVGKAPADLPDNKARHEWTTNALFKFGFASNGPLVSAIWYSDPDGAAHEHGMGSPEAVLSIKNVDEQFGRILSYLKQNNLLPYYNIIVSADHGFVTYIGKDDLEDFLISQKFKKDRSSDDVVVADGAIYIKDHKPKLKADIVKALQRQPWIGAIFTKGAKPGDMKGSVTGTLSFESIYWQHPTRSADILADVMWNDDANSAGYAGSSFSKGVAGHGSISPYEIHIALMASGPSFKKNYESDIPTSNVDIVPTILHLHHIDFNSVKDGRIMEELLAESTQSLPAVLTDSITAENPKNKLYSVTLYTSTVSGHRYINFARATRSPK